MGRRVRFCMKGETHFKGWAKPGPVPPGLSAGLSVAPDETLDAISGHFRLFQLRDGHRFSTDDILTAWYGTSWCPTARTALDLGSGIGTVGMIVAWRLPGARLVTVEDAMAQRPYAGASELRFELVDSFCAWNAGAWRVVTSAEGAQAARIDGQDVDFTLTPDTLASLVFGRFSATQAAGAANGEGCGGHHGKIVPDFAAARE